MNFTLVLPLLLSFLILAVGDRVHPLNHEAYLRLALFSNWSEADIHSRPVLNISDTIRVTMGLEVYHVKYLDEMRQVLTLNALMHLRWENPHFKWDRSDYGGLESITLPLQYLWSPDIYLLNSANGGEVVLHGPSEARLTYNGTITWKPQVLLHAMCTLDNFHFPFDENICTLQFASWTMDGYNLNLLLDPYFEKNFFNIPHKSFNEWKIVDSHSTRNIIYLACCAEPFVDLRLTLYLQRQATVYSYTLLIPLIVTMMIMLVMFYLPPMAGEKFILGGMNTVILTIILIHIYWITARTSSLPVIVSIAGTTFFFMSLSLIISVATTLLSLRTDAAPALLERHLRGRLGSLLYIPSVPIQIMENSDDDPKNHWGLVAIAVNRICFIIYTILVLILIIFMFAS